MAQNPSPRTPQQILGDMLEAFFSRTGLNGLRIGGTAQSTFESVAQSQARATQDVFAASNANDPSRLRGEQLDRYGNSKGVKRRSAIAASSYVTIGDSAFTKISSTLSPLHSPPIPGQTTLYIQEGSSFSNTGSVYIGRGTDSFEGPITYTAKTDNGSDWSLTLLNPINRRHDGSELVVLAQGGDRTINSGTIVKSQQGNALSAAQFSVTSSVVIPDGEVQIQNVQVICTETGEIGNCNSNTINSFGSLPFATATVFNPLPITNGEAIQQDGPYLVDIYKAEEARSKGTPLAIERAAIGATSNDEASKVISASYVRKVNNEPDLLTIDNGTGYQPIHNGIAQEFLVNSAKGGEIDFQLANSPILKATCFTNIAPPWNILEGDRLAFAVGGVVTEHILDPNSYTSIDPYSVASDCNSNESLLWEAIVLDNSQKIGFRSKSEFNDDIKSITPSSGRNAASVLGITEQIEETLFLYKDDILLYKDGLPATIGSRPISQWSGISGSQTITIAVDNTAATTYTITDTDFVNANTGFNTVGINTITAWATVLQNKIPGISGVGTLGKVFLTSNLGSNSRAKISIQGGSLVASGMFIVSDAIGRTKDYDFDRSLGQGTLTTPLLSKQELTIGSTQTRGLLQSTPASLTTFVSPAVWWIGVDGDFINKTSSLTPGSNFTATVAASGQRRWGALLRLNAGVGSFNTISPKDYVIFWDTTSPSTLTGAWVIANVASDGSWIEIDRHQTLWARSWAASTVLPDNRVFVCGGYGYKDKQCPLSSAEIFDPNTNIWTHAGYMAVPRVEGWAVSLNNGKVLVGGGAATGLPEVWDNGSFTPTSAANAPVYGTGQAAILASDGYVYVTGGNVPGVGVSNTVKKYNHTTDVWSVVASMATPRHRHTLDELGGLLYAVCGSDGATALNTAEGYDLGLGTWAAAGTLANGRQGHASFTINGSIVITGGNSSISDPPTRLNTTSILTTLPWMPGPIMNTARAYHKGAVLTVGTKALVVGGENAASPAELYDAIANTFANTGTPDLSARTAPTVATLPNDQVLFAHGDIVQSANFYPVATSEKWDLNTAIWEPTDPVAGTTFSLTSGGISFVNSPHRLNKLEVGAATNLTNTSLATYLNTEASKIGSSVNTYRTSNLRWNTNTFPTKEEGLSTFGSIYVAASNTEAKKVLLPEQSNKYSSKSQSGYLVSADQEGTPEFQSLVVLGSVNEKEVGIYWSNMLTNHIKPTISHYLVGGFAESDSYTQNRIGQNYLFSTQMANRKVINLYPNAQPVEILSLRNGPEHGWTAYDRPFFASPWALGPEDGLTVVANSNDQQRYNINTYRKLVPTNVTYGLTNTFNDANLSPIASLGTSFGINYDFTDHTVMMRARGKSHAADITKRVLWRWWQFGRGGELAEFAYGAPLNPNAIVTVTVDDITPVKTQVLIRLAGGALKTGATLRSTSKVGITAVTVTGEIADLVIACGMPISSASRAANVSTLTLTLPTGITNHGFQIGDVLYIKSTSVNFTSGPKTLTGISPTTISYAEVAANAGPDVNIGTVSFDIAEDTFTTIAPAPAVSDWFKFDIGATGVGVFGDQTYRITGSSDQVLYAKSTTVAFISSTILSWYPLLDADFFQLFVNPKQTVTQIAASVATIYAAGNSPINPTITGDGTGIIDRSTNDELGVSNSWYSLYDGQNAIASQIAPLIPTNPYSFTFKDPVEASLATNADWINEDVRLIPVTAIGLRNWFNSGATSGLSTTITTEVAGNGKKVQLSTPIGSSNSIQVQGGSANYWSVNVIGQAQQSNGGDFMVFEASPGSATGLVSDAWGSITLSTPADRNVITSTTSLSLATSAGRLTVTAGSPQLWTFAGSNNNNVAIVIEKQGKFVKYQNSGIGSNITLATVVEGDWVFVSVPSASTAVPQISSANVGLFRVVRTDNLTQCFWVEDTGQINEGPVEMDAKWITDGSVLPGDTLIVGTSLWGSTGEWKVKSIGDNGGGPFTDVRTVTLDTGTRAFNSLTGPIPLNAQYPLVRFVPSIAQKWFKKIKSITVNNNNQNIRVRVEGGAGYGDISDTYGAVFTLLDKLNFLESRSIGRDGYRYYTGLVGEVNKIEYGDPRDNVTYPGVIAGGCEVRIDGPKIRRITFGVAVRLQQGIAPVDVEASVKSTVASVVKKRPHGQPIPISDILREVSRVQGITSVVPTGSYDIVNDTIPVEPGERAMVLDLADVSVSYLG